MPELTTDREIAGLKHDGKRRLFKISGARGLRLDMRIGGAMSWIVWYRTKAGRARTHTLGRYPEMPLAQARAQARAIMAKVELDRDPMGERLVARRHAEEERHRSELAKSTSVEALTNRCLDELPLRPRTLKEWRRLADVEIIPALGGRQAGEVTRQEIREWAAQIRDGHRYWRRELGPAPYTANRAFEVLRRVYSWSVEMDLLPSTPFFRLEVPALEQQSERVLSADEVHALWLALDRIGGAYADAVRLLLLTGVRREMAAGMCRSELEDAEGKEPRWTIPGGFNGRSKSGRPHVVPLSPTALGVIRRRLLAVDGERLFPPARDAAADSMWWSSRFVRDLKTTTEDLVGRPMARWTIHNLRHTIGTHLREDLKVSSEVVSLILGHTPPGPRVSRVYNRAELLPERREALTAWATWISDLSRR